MKNYLLIVAVAFISSCCGVTDTDDQALGRMDNEIVIHERSGTIGIWSSREELATIPMSGHEWDLVLSSANRNTSNPDVGNQNDNTNCYVLAAAIASERYYAAGDIAKGDSYRNKVVAAVEKIVSDGWPAGSRSLAWGREIGAYAMAADLVGYRTAQFEQYLYDAVNTWQCSERNQSLLKMSQQRPNNWGTMGFGTLCAIYVYLGDASGLADIRSRWVSAIEGPSHKNFKYNSDLTWQGTSETPMVINLPGTEKDGISLDGLQPEEMRRGSSFSNPPVYTEYPFESLQGWVMAARVLDRAGMPIWESGQRAIFRAFYALQVYLNANFGQQWSFENDDIWMLGFIDKAYDSSLAAMAETDTRGFGKNAGYVYVTLAD